MRALPLLAPLALATAALGAALLFAPGASGALAHVYLLAVALIVAFAAIKAITLERRVTTPSLLDPVLRQRAPARVSPEDLEVLERVVSIGTSTAFDLHYRLRPMLFGIAEGVLLGRGIDLVAQPDRAREALGEQAWALLRPDRTPPRDRQARGLTVDELDAIVQGIEAAR